MSPANARKTFDKGEKMLPRNRPGFVRHNCVSSRFLRLGLAVLVSLAAMTIASNSPARADTTPAVIGSSWLGGHGVNACSMTGTWDGVSCGGDGPVGSAWQCVELAQREYYRLGWYTSNSGYFANVLHAYQIYNEASNLGMTAHLNGSGYIPVPGDMIVHTSADGGGDGHVSVVDRISGSTVYVAEQNISSAADIGNYSLSGSTLSRTGMNIQGVVHSPSDLYVNSRMMVIDSGNTAYSRDSIGSGGWTTQWTGATAITVGGSGRMNVMDSSGYVYSKDNPSDNWTTAQAGPNAKAIAVGSSGRIMVMDSSGYVYARENPADSWSSALAGPNAKAIAVGGGGRMMVIDSGNTAYSRDSITSGGWTTQRTGATAIAVGSTGRMVVMDSSGYVYAKDNPGDNWSSALAGPNAKAIAVGGYGRIMVIDSGNTAYSRDSITSGGWTTQRTGATAIAVRSTGRMMVIDSSGYVYAKDNPGDNWSSALAGPNAKAIAVS
jgi:hypothetical protein